MRDLTRNPETGNNPICNFVQYPRTGRSYGWQYWFWCFGAFNKQLLNVTNCLSCSHCHFLIIQEQQIEAAASLRPTHFKVKYFEGIGVTSSRDVTAFLDFLKQIGRLKVMILHRSSKEKIAKLHCKFSWVCLFVWLFALCQHEAKSQKKQFYFFISNLIDRLRDRQIDQINIGLYKSTHIYSRIYVQISSKRLAARVIGTRPMQSPSDEFSFGIT